MHLNLGRHLKKKKKKRVKLQMLVEGFLLGIYPPPKKKCPGYDTKVSDVEALVLEL